MTATLGILLDPSNYALTARCCSLQRGSYDSITDALSAGILKVENDSPNLFRSVIGNAKQDGACFVWQSSISNPPGHNSNAIHHISTLGLDAGWQLLCNFRSCDQTVAGILPPKASYSARGPAPLLCSTSIL